MDHRFNTTFEHSQYGSNIPASQLANEYGTHIPLPQSHAYGAWQSAMDMSSMGPMQTMSVMAPMPGMSALGPMPGMSATTPMEGMLSMGPMAGMSSMGPIPYGYPQGYESVPSNVWSKFLHRLISSLFVCLVSFKLISIVFFFSSILKIAQACQRADSAENG